MGIDFAEATWINPPRQSRVTAGAVEIVTDPATDFWQRTYYGFRNDNAPALLMDSATNFTFTTKAMFDYQALFDQCGVIIYLDSDTWFKASVEYENAEFSRLGSVVTNLGHSDWATTDIETPPMIWYRLSRRGPDFLIESSFDGHDFRQMRIFHLYALGETTAEMGHQDPPAPPTDRIRFGLYACSPLQSSFVARFSDFKFEGCIWRTHEAGT